MSKAKEAYKRYMETIEKGGRTEWARKTKFVPQPDVSLRRIVTRKDGTVEKDEIIPADRKLVAEARSRAGLSQEKFAELLGISPRTLRDWEQGRRNPSGAAKTLLLIAAKHPEVLRELAAQHHLARKVSDRNSLAMDRGYPCSTLLAVLSVTTRKC